MHELGVAAFAFQGARSRRRRCFQTRSGMSRRTPPFVASSRLHDSPDSCRQLPAATAGRGSLVRTQRSIASVGPGASVRTGRQAHSSVHQQAYEPGRYPNRAPAAAGRLGERCRCRSLPTLAIWHRRSSCVISRCRLIHQSDDSRRGRRKPLCCQTDNDHACGRAQQAGQHGVQAGFGVQTSQLP